MITLEHVYVFGGLIFAGIAVLSARDRTNEKRLGNAAFWGLLAASFLFGSHLSDAENGVLALALVLIGGFGFLGRGAPATTAAEERRSSAARLGNWLFAAALIIPVTALLGTVFLKDVHVGRVPLLDATQATIISLAFGVILSLIVTMVWLKPPLLAPLEEGRSLVDTVGWAALLPQMLASLGAVFTLSGVGTVVGHIATTWLPLNTPLAAVVAYCVGMALFTAVMGNAFAAFPVMTAAVGLPLIVRTFGGNVAVMASIGMLSGFCGTLTTPMAANFNIVPAVLLELPDRQGVIKVQAPTAVLLLIANTILMYLCVYRFQGLP
jgi:uncharacterized membrane protein